MALMRFKSLELTTPARGGQLILRHPRWSDYDDWASLRRRNEDYLQPWEPEWSSDHLSRRSYKNRLSAYERMLQNQSGYPFHLFIDDGKTFIGAAHLTQIKYAPAMSAELGYWLGEEFAGKGFGRAAIRSILPFAFETLGLHRVQAAVQSDNIRSVKLLEACGFVHEGRARHYLKIDGVWRDHDIYARLSSD